MTLYFVLIAVCVLCAVAYCIHITKVRRQAARSKAQVSTDELLLQRQCVTFDCHPGIWDARAKICEAYADGATPPSPRPVGVSRAHAAPYTGAPSPAPSDD